MSDAICPKCGKQITDALRGRVVRLTQDAAVVRIVNVCHEFELSISGLQDSHLNLPLGLKVGDAIALSGLTEMGQS